MLTARAEPQRAEAGQALAGAQCLRRHGECRGVQRTFRPCGRSKRDAASPEEACCTACTKASGEQAWHVLDAIRAWIHVHADACGPLQPLREETDGARSHRPRTDLAQTNRFMDHCLCLLRDAIMCLPVPGPRRY